MFELIVGETTAKIITLRAIALKQCCTSAFRTFSVWAKIITLRAIALKHMADKIWNSLGEGEDHNATSYSTETFWRLFLVTLCGSEDHNATSYSTETTNFVPTGFLPEREDHNATSYSTETKPPTTTIRRLKRRRS